MMSKNEKKCKFASVGGQALIEGIMMQGPKGAVIAVRTPDGNILTEKRETNWLRTRYKIANLPIIRGIINFVETLIFGYQCLMFSAEKSGLDDMEEENASKFDKWLTDHLGKQIVPIVSAISTVLGFVLAIGLFIYLPSWLVDLAASAESLQRFHPLFEGILRIIIFILYMFVVSFIPDIKRTFMYHGAEHKSIFCYERGEELTVENVKKQKRFHPRCGTSFIFLTILLSILISSVLVLLVPRVQALTGTKLIDRLIWSAIKILLIPLIMGIGYEFIKYAGKHDNIFTKIVSAPGLWMQRITTKEPTDDIIEVGIASLKAVLYEYDDETKNDDNENEEETDKSDTNEEINKDDEIK